jgi:transposase
MRTGLPWRDVPFYFGVWISIYQQFNRWSLKNKVMAIFKALVQEPDLEWGFIDGSIVKAHQHLFENIFARLKHFRAIASRYDKLKRNYASMVVLARGFMWLPM